MTFSLNGHVLLRWADGLVHFGSGREQYVEVRGIKTYEEALELAESISNAVKGTRATSAPTGHVFDSSQQPGVGFYVADKMDGQRIQSITIGMDSEGETTVAPELGDPLTYKLAALERKVAKANAHSPSEWTSPFPDGKPTEQLNSTIPSFTWKYTKPPPIES